MAEGEEKVRGASLRQRPAQELAELLRTKREDLRKARFAHASGELRQTHTLGQLRHAVAQIATVLRQQADKESKAS